MITNRWGHTFAKGAWCMTKIGPARYVGLAPPSDFSRAYGRQAYVYVGHDPMPTIAQCREYITSHAPLPNDGHATECGADDIRPHMPAAKP